MEVENLLSTKTQMHMSLTLLPVELLELIFSYIDLPTFQSLRLTSSHLAISTTHYFKTRFFTTQQLSWTKPSLQRLLSISTHPDLGTALQFLTIDATPHYAQQLWTLHRRSSDASHSTPPSTSDDSSLTQRFDREFLSVFAAAETQAKWFNETRFDIRCLTSAFARLTFLESLAFRYDALACRYAKFGYRYVEHSQHEASRPFVSTMAALAAAGLLVKRIEMPEGGGYDAVSIGRLESLAPRLGRFDAVFEQLGVLQLNLRDWRCLDVGFEVERRKAPFVVRFFAKCRSVRVLELDCYSALEEDLFGEMARACRFEKLQFCVLGSCRIKHASDLLAFLLPSSTSLKELRLQHILLVDPEATWSDLFICLADTNSGLTVLQTLQAEDLFTERGGHGKRLTFHDCKSATNSLQVGGSNWRQDLKSRVSDHVEIESLKSWETGAMMYAFAG